MIRNSRRPRRAVPAAALAVALAFAAAMALAACATLRLQDTAVALEPTEGGAGRPLRILQLSDLHFVAGRPVYAAVQAMVNAADPDLLVVTGDFLTDGRQLDGLLAWLAGLRLDCPKLAVRGNWEYARGGPAGVPLAELTARTEALGFVWLVNRGLDLAPEPAAAAGGRRVYAYGLDDYLKGKPDWSGFRPEAGQLNLVLAHCPVLFDRLNADFADPAVPVLMLSGHTHGGQIAPFGWAPILPKGAGRYVAGLYAVGANRLYVSRGVGTRRIDLRLGADPAVELIDWR
jgi:predicted MPP superfamily phosphohydrolase